MIIYFIRHGQTDETGLKQAEETRDLLLSKGITYERIYCSPLDRALTTCEIVSGKKRDSFIIDKRLEEINVGDLAHTSMLVDDPYTIDFIKHPDRFVPHPGAESYQDMIDRVGSFLDDLKREQPAEKILVACHRGPIQSVVMNLDAEGVPEDHHPERLLSGSGTEGRRLQGHESIQKRQQHPAGRIPVFLRSILRKEASYEDRNRL